MKLIIGLGNPGTKYTKTRHNAGFLCLDFLRNAFEFPEFAPEKRFSASISSGTLGTEKVLLIKPETFMNHSGSAVKTLVDFYKLSISNIVLLHDDLDIERATFRTTESSRAAGHNGVQDVIDQLGTQDFFRIRLGIGRPTEVLNACVSSHDFVLQNFSEEEYQALSSVFPTVKQTLLHWIQQ